MGDPSGQLIGGLSFGFSNFFAPSFLLFPPVREASLYCYC
jgi:hypothetical protein